ncbi:MAG: hypothetical protein EBR20_04625 [Bacteroidetes bacterium]|nr:hypothetical protein [Bacteroidota bacterium]
MIGTIGKLLILVSFVAVVLSGITFLRSSKLETRVGEWKRIGRISWWVATFGTLGAFGLLIYLNVTHAFEYAYVYENTAMDLSTDYLVAAAWAGQEGSFLLWIVMNALVGLAVISFAREYEAPVMAIIALCQAFLISMIAGLQIGPIPIGSSPFATLAEKFPTAPMIQAGIIPTDGQGLNDLLRNYWMVIRGELLARAVAYRYSSGPHNDCPETLRAQQQGLFLPGHRGLHAGRLFHVPDAQRYPRRYLGPLLC